MIDLVNVELGMAEGVACLRCGYDLRGLDAGSICPECGLEIAATLSPRQRLEECPPGWVRGLSVGCWVVLAAGVLFLVTWWLNLFDIKQGMTPAQVMYRINMMQLTAGAFFGVQAAGFWMVGRREPRKKRGWGEWAAMWGLFVLALGPVGFFVVEMARLNLGSYMRSGWHWMLMLTYVPCPAILFLQLRRLGIRVGRPRLAEHAGIVGVGLSGCLGVIVAMVMMDMESRWMIVMVLPVAGMILTCFWGLFLLGRAAWVFWRVARETQEKWDKRKEAY